MTSIQKFPLWPLRAAVIAERHGRLREFSRAVFRWNFGETGRLDDIDTIARAAEDADLDPQEVRAHIADDDVKQAVKDATDAAIDLGVFGVPTVQVGDELFWGDDRLEEASAALEVATG